MTSHINGLTHPEMKDLENVVSPHPSSQKERHWRLPTLSHTQALATFSSPNCSLLLHYLTVSSIGPPLHSLYYLSQLTTPNSWLVSLGNSSLTITPKPNFVCVLTPRTLARHLRPCGSCLSGRSTRKQHDSSAASAASLAEWALDLCESYLPPSVVDKSNTYANSSVRGINELIKLISTSIAMALFMASTFIII